MESGSSSRGLSPGEERMEVERPASKIPLCPGSSIACSPLFCTGRGGGSSVPECSVLLPGQESWLVWDSGHLPS